MASKPEVFIIETLDPKSERKERFEGRIISSILSLSCKTCEYYYVRTEKELQHVLRIFTRSGFRYLHLSCHGSRTRMHMTLDVIPFARLAELLRPRLHNRRLFLSACDLTNYHLANRIFPASTPGCTSMLGPTRSVGFAQGAIFWSSLYHVMFAEDATTMKHGVLRAKAQALANIYDLQLNYFGRNPANEHGYEFHQIAPNENETAA